MRNQYTITVEDAPKINEYRERVKDEVKDRRIHAVRLVVDGMKYQKVADKLECKV